MQITRRRFISGIAGTACCGHSIEVRADAAMPAGRYQVLCGLQDMPSLDFAENIREARPEAIRAVDIIAGLIGLRPEFGVLEGEFTKTYIAAAITRNKRRYVVLDSKWFLLGENKVPWYAIYILGHEIGHHILGHTHRFMPDRIQGELDADRFGGWAVARLGGRLDQALSFMSSLSEDGGFTHPPRSKRIEATIDGWTAGTKGS